MSRDPTVEERRLLALIIEEMEGRTGSATLHFKKGEVKRLEFRTFRDAKKAA